MRLVSIGHTVTVILLFKSSTSGKANSTVAATSKSPSAHHFLLFVCLVCFATRLVQQCMCLAMSKFRVVRSKRNFFLRVMCRVLSFFFHWLLQSIQRTAHIVDSNDPKVHFFLFQHENKPIGCPCWKHPELFAFANACSLHPFYWIWSCVHIPKWKRAFSCKPRMIWSTLEYGLHLLFFERIMIRRKRPMIVGFTRLLHF